MKDIQNSMGNSIVVKIIVISWKALDYLPFNNPLGL
jgi:hypothetical protein